MEIKKEYVIGGLAVIGAIGVIAYLNQPKKNSEGFFNAVGGGTKDTKPDYAFWATANGVCTLYVHGVNADGTKAYYKSASNPTDTYKLIPIKGNEYYLASKLPKCYIKK